MQVHRYHIGAIFFQPVDIQEAEEKSRDLIFNIHGGGGVAYSSESEEMYLRKWTNNLNVPVYSVGKFLSYRL